MIKNIAFDPAIWGTIPEWATVLLAAITARYFYLTLKSQIAVQKLQQKTAEIELFRHRENIKPQFILEAISPQGIQKNDGKVSLHINYTIKSNHQFSKDITLSVKTNLIWSLKPMLPPTFTNSKIIIKNFKPDDLIIMVGSCLVDEREESYLIGTSMLVFKIEYRDLLENKYSQELSCMWAISEPFVQNKQPELLKS